MLDQVWDFKQVATWLGYDEIIYSESAPKTALPKVKYFNDVTNTIANNTEQKPTNLNRCTEWTASKPFSSKVVEARWLTSAHETVTEHNWTEVKQVAFVNFSLNNSFINYLPGDSIGICCPNPEHLVQIVLERLQTEENSDQFTLQSSVTYTDPKKSPSTLGDVLSHEIDLVGCPKKAQVATLSQYCSDPIEQKMMEHLSSKSEFGKAMWGQLIEAQGVGLGELLAMFPSCKPNLSQLLQCTSAIPPRYYSVASSPLVDANQLSIAFSVVRNKFKITAPAKDPAVEMTPPEIRRLGTCTNYLVNLLAPWLRNSSNSAENQPQAEEKASAGLTTTNRNIETVFSPCVTVKLFHKSSITFHLPGSVNPPLILIGPGTGVAPFIGFLQHRDALESGRRSNSGGEEMSTGLWRGGFDISESDLPCECNTVDRFIHSVLPGPIHLFFGCRNQHDFLFKECLEGQLARGTLSTLEVAMSRVSAEKVYVTHKIQHRAKEIARLILCEGAYVYVCGDGNQMAKDVYCAIKEVLVAQTATAKDPLTAERAEAILQEMKLRRRYVLDIWS